MVFRLSDAADGDIVRLYADGVRDFGLSQADSYHDALFDVFDLLAANPKMARERPDMTPPVRAHPFRTHVIIYQIENNDILIIRVRHGREDWIASNQ